MHRNSKGTYWLYDDILIHFCEFFYFDVGSLSEFSHVGQHERILIVGLYLVRECLEFFAGLEAFREYHVSATVDLLAGPFDCCVQSLHSIGVSARADHEVSVAVVHAALLSLTNFEFEFVHGDQSLAIQMAASFGEFLVLEMCTRCAMHDVLAHCHIRIV